MEENHELGRYRETLVQGRDDAQASFDKAIMTLSGGALGLALGFVRAGATPSWAPVLWVAWACFAGSLLSTLFSFRSSFRSFDSALEQLGSTLDRERIYSETVGGQAARLTARLNTAALSLFLVGVLALAVFVGVNLDKLR